MIGGFDIGGTKVEFAIFDQSLGRVTDERLPTPTASYAALIDLLVGMVARGEQAAGLAAGAMPVGLGLPGLVTSEGKSLCANLPIANGRHVATDLAARLGRAVASENDCRCFALSEADGGAGANQRVVFGSILGTGAAGGLVVDGKLARGRQGIAGEYGHYQLSAVLAERHGLPPLTCGCGLPGCVESYIAGPGLVRLYRGRGGAAASASDVIAAVRNGDDRAHATFAIYLDLLGAAFAPIVMSYDPDIIVLGGGMSLVDEVVAALPGAIRPHLFAGFSPPPIERARFGDASGARGAAILARQAAQ